uniref:hypothetical protein n=1 Tax=Paenirhodobacter enshiensis TaxID=1105367 RepID=UPI0035B398EA
MLRINLDRGPRWFDLGHGVRLQVDPVTALIVSAARQDAEVQSLDPASVSQEQLGIAMSRAIARRVIRDWEGVGDADGAALPVSDGAVDALLDVWELFERFQALVIAPAMLVDQEKNVSAPSPNGTTAAAKTTAAPAKGAAKRARRKSTPRKR